LLVGVTFSARLRNVEFDITQLETPRLTPVVDPPVIRIPHESNGQTHFVQSDTVAAIQAEGRYTHLYHHSGRLFCPWSITRLESKLEHSSFVKGHRSYLVNTDHVTSFERKKDNGLCFFEGNAHLDQVPVSRSYLKHMRESLGL